jgi:hypothetical protein
MSNSRYGDRVTVDGVGIRTHMCQLMSGYASDYACFDRKLEGTIIRPSRSERADCT